MKLSTRGQHVLTHVFVIISIALFSSALISFVGPRWETFSLPVQLVYSFGVAAIAYSIAVGLCCSHWGQYLHAPSLALAAITIPWGIRTLWIHRVYSIEGFQQSIDFLLPYITKDLPFSITLSGVMLLLFSIAWYRSRSTVSLVGIIAYSHLLFVESISYLEIAHYLEPYIRQYHFNAYLNFLISIVYLVLSHLLEHNYHILTLILRFFAPLVISFHICIFGGWFFDHGFRFPFFWRSVWPLLSTSLVTLGLKKNDNALLISGMISLITFIFVVGWKYGQETLGTPLLLCLLGFVFLGLSYAIITLKRIAQPSGD